VLDIPLDRVNFMCKLVPTKGSTTIPFILDETLEQSPEFRREYESDQVTREWVDIARRLEGTNRNAGTHAAGGVIAHGPLTNYVPVQIVKRKDESGETRQKSSCQCRLTTSVSLCRIDDKNR